MSRDAIKLKLVLYLQKNIIKSEGTKLLEQFEKAIRKEAFKEGVKEAFKQLEKSKHPSHCWNTHCADYIRTKRKLMKTGG